MKYKMLFDFFPKKNFCSKMKYFFVNLQSTFYALGLGWVVDVLYVAHLKKKDISFSTYTDS